MLGRRFVFGLILFKAFLLHEAHSQCKGESKNIQPEKLPEIIKSPDFPETLGKANTCEWKFTSSNTEEYMLVLTVKKLRLYYVADEEKKCSGYDILKINKDTVDCEKYVDAPHTDKFCNAYYSSPTCNTTMVQACKPEQTSFPIKVTYESKGKTLAGDTGSMNGFKIEYKYIECPASCPEDDADCVASGSGGPAKASGSGENDGSDSSAKAPGKPNMHAPAITTTHSLPTTVKQETPPLSNTSVDTAKQAGPSASYDQSTAAFIVMGVVIFGLLVIVAVLALRRRSTHQSSEAPPESHYQNIDASVVALGNRVSCAEAASEEPRQAYYENLPAKEQNLAENPYEIPIQRNQNMDV